MIVFFEVVYCAYRRFVLGIRIVFIWFFVGVLGLSFCLDGFLSFFNLFLGYEFVFWGLEYVRRSMIGMGGVEKE